MEAPTGDPEQPVASRWWYWIVAYPVVGLLAIPFFGLVAVFFFVTMATIEGAGGTIAGPVILVVMLFAAILAFSFVLLAFVVFVMLPVALYFDAKAVAQTDLDWEPDPFVYAILGALQFFVTPIIGLMVAIYYLYRRHTDVGVP